MSAGAGKTGPLVAVLPASRLAGALAHAVTAGGCVPTGDVSRAEGLVWCRSRPDGLAELLEAAPHLRWVQLPYAGIEAFGQLVDSARTWTCAKGVYGAAVAEFALGLILAGLRRIDRYAARRVWEPLPQQTLDGRHVAILGAGGIGLALTRLLLPFGARVSVVSRSGRPVEGATALPFSETADVLADADVVVLALPLVAETTGLVDAAFLSGMKRSAWLVNVARGRVVVTDDLVAALKDGVIAGAALDVTDPEPLPPGHALWKLPNAIVTPHVANTPETGTGSLMALVEENCRRLASGVELAGRIDPALGY